MSISKIKVKNFQSILDGEVDLGQFTVFTGPSSSGKSAFVRAAHAVIRNSFNPTQVTVGHKVSEVSVTVDDHEITAIRGKSKSTYILDGVEYTKAGRNVPDAIVDVLSMPEVSDVETSFSYQFDKPYLLADPGSVASKVLGSLTNVSVLHASLKESNRRNRELGSRYKVKSTDLAAITDKLETFQELDKKVKLVEETDELISDIERHTSDHSSISRATDRAESLAHEVENVRGLLLVADRVDSLKEESSANDVSKVQRLNSILLQIESLEKSIPTWDFNNVPETLSNSNQISDIRRLSDILEVEVLIRSLPTLDFNSVPSADDLPSLRRAQDVDNLLSTFARVFKELSDGEPKITEYENKIGTLQHEHNNLLKDIDVCPLCLTPIHA